MHRHSVVISSFVAKAAMAAVILCFSASSLRADDAAVRQHIEAAEEALTADDLWTAASEYHKAAALSEDTVISRQATRLAYTYRFNELARASAERWVELAEDSDEARLHLALAELRDGDIRASRRSFQVLLKRGEQAADERLVDLIPFLYDEDPANAYKLMKQLAKPYKSSAHANYAVAVMALYADETEEAAERAKLAAELKADWLKPHLLYARALMTQGKVDEAIDYTARLVGDSPDPDPEARLELAIMYVSDGRDDDALSQVNQVLLEQPSRTDALRLLAIINFRLDNLDAAWQDFEDLLASGSYTMDAFYYLARIADRRDEHDRAMALYSKVSMGDNAVISQRRVSGILAQREKFEEAHAHLERFGREHPKFTVDMLQSQAQLYATQEKFDEALAYYDRVVKYRPDSESTLLGKGELLLRMGRLEDAIVVYRQAIDKWPDSAISLNALGYTLADRTTEYREASRLIRKALKIDPDSAAIIDSYGWVLYRLGKLEDALAELERAYSQFEDPEVAAHIVEVLWKLARQDEAMDRLVEAEERWPDSEILESTRVKVAPDS